MKKKKLLIVVVVTLLIAVVSVAIVLMNRTNLKVINDTVDVEAGEDYVFNGVDFFGDSYNKFSDKDFSVDISKINTSSVGTYDVSISVKKNTYTVYVNVIDTRAPEFIGEGEYIFTNDINNVLNLAESKELFSDATSVSIGLEEIIYVRDFISPSSDEFESAVDDFYLADFSDAPVATDFTSGIYGAKLDFVDEGNNKTTAFLMVVLDLDSPYLVNESGEIAELCNLVVEQEDLSVEPAYDMQGLSFKDNDSIVDSNTSIAVKDNDNHIYTVTAEASDTVGNSSSFTYDISVAQKVDKVVASGGSAQNGGSSNKPNKSNAPNKSNGGSNSNSSSSASNSDNTGSSGDSSNNDSAGGSSVGTSAPEDGYISWDENPYARPGYRPTSWEDAYKFYLFSSGSEEFARNAADANFPSSVDLW